jgi:uncharacterized protein (TIGR03435 family)
MMVVNPVLHLSSTTCYRSAIEWIVMKFGWILAEIVLIAGSASAQISRPAFDAASIRLNTGCDTGGGRSGGASTPGRIAIECADLRDLILTAYGIYGNDANPASGSFRMQVVGGQAWMDSTRYDIVAKPAGNPLRSEMYGPMLQSLLEDRFKLKVHRETREGRVYLLTAAWNGPKLRAAKEGTCLTADVNHPPEPGVRLRGCVESRTSALAALLLRSISPVPRSRISAPSSAFAWIAR